MPTVELWYPLARPRADIWAALMNVESYPSYMSNVHGLEILSQDGNLRVSRWQVVLVDSELEWDEEDRIDSDRCQISFRLVEGDLARLEGYWAVHERPDGCTVEFRAEFRLGIPLMEDLLGPIAEEALSEGIREILGSIGDRTGEVTCA